MGFSPDVVGLFGERISGRFLEPRPNGCPHKGLDISSSGISKPFYAGIYGKVVPPVSNQSQWCTIAIQPFSYPDITVQYLHASSSNVSIGDLVAPWTIAGYTGNCSPTPVPIHLHIQVLDSDVSPYTCWNGRNFIDPETWDTKSALVGIWSNADQGRNYSAVTNIFVNNDSTSGKIGEIESRVHWFWTNRTGANCEANTLHKFDLICLGTDQKNIMNVRNHNTSSTVINSTCPFRANMSDDMDAQITVDSAYGLSVKVAGGVTFYNKGAQISALPEINLTVEVENIQKDVTIISGLNIIGFSK